MVSLPACSSCCICSPGAASCNPTWPPNSCAATAAAACKPACMSIAFLLSSAVVRTSSQVSHASRIVFDRITSRFLQQHIHSPALTVCTEVDCCSPAAQALQPKQSCYCQWTVDTAQLTWPSCQCCMDGGITGVNQMPGLPQGRCMYQVCCVLHLPFQPLGLPQRLSTEPSVTISLHHQCVLAQTAQVQSCDRERSLAEGVTHSSPDQQHSLTGLRS